MFIKRIIKFILHKRKSNDITSLAIRMRVTLKGEQPIDFPTGCKVNLDQWDSKSEMVISNTTEANAINATISEYRSKINEIFAKYELIEKRVPTPLELKSAINEKLGKANTYQPKKLDFWEVFDLFTDQMGRQNQWTRSTHQKFSTIKGHIKDYNKNISLERLTEEDLQGLVDYYNGLQFRNTTISKHISFIRWFLRWANQKGYYQGNLHDTFRPKFKGISVDSKEIIYLTQDEIRLLQESQFPPSRMHLERVRDVFLFQCFTGLRYSDVAKLKNSDIKNGVVHVVTKKTVDKIRIELNKHSQAILDKYKDCKFDGDRALPVITNQKMNDNLKEVGQVAGLEEPTRIVYFRGNKRYEEVYPKWQLLTTHVGRRTFVVTALQLGIPVEVIMRWTGHSNFEAMKPYAKIVDDLKKKSMSKFDSL